MGWVSAVLLAAVLAAPEPAPGSWLDSYEQALETSAKENRPLLIFFEAPWCGWCKAMEKDSFTEPTVQELMNGFTKVKVDIDAAPRIAFAFQVTSVPRLVAANVHGEITGDSLGYLEPVQLAAFLRDSAAQATPTGGPRLPSIEKELPAEAPPSDLSLYGGDALAALGDPEPRVRAAAMKALAERGQEAVPELLQALGSDYLGTRIGAYEALQELKAAPESYDPWAPRAEREAGLNNKE